MKTAAVLLIALGIGGCVADGPGLSTSPGAPSAKSARTIDDTDTPKQLCVDTAEGGEGKKVCY